MEIQLLYKANKRDKVQNRSSANLLHASRSKQVSRAGEAFEEVKQQEVDRSRKVLDIFKNIKQSHSVRNVNKTHDVDEVRADGSKSPFSNARQDDARAEHYRKWDRAAKLTSQSFHGMGKLKGLSLNVGKTSEVSAERMRTPLAQHSDRVTGSTGQHPNLQVVHGKSTMERDRSASRLRSERSHDSALRTRSVGSHVDAFHS